MGTGVATGTGVVVGEGAVAVVGVGAVIDLGETEVVVVEVDGRIWRVSNGLSGMRVGRKMMMSWNSMMRKKKPMMMLRSY